MEMKKQLTPSEAILDFEERYFDGLFTHKKGEKQKPGYSACLKAFASARAGEITFERAARILYKYAPPGVYEITERIEVAEQIEEAHTEPYKSRHTEFAQKFKAEHPDSFYF